MSGRKISREELVAELQRRFAVGGFDGISPMIDKMLTDGQMHEPEFVPCQDCGADIERSNTPTRQQIRCNPCRQIHQNTLDRNRKRAKRGRSC